MPTIDPLCSTFQERARDTWADFRDDHIQRPNSIREDTYTSNNLREIGRRHRDRVIIKDFSSSGEAVTGADWEWWFTDGYAGLGFRVQAKRINPGTLKYEELGYYVGKTGNQQCDVLIQNAEQSIGGPLFPLYCFYNFFDPNRQKGKLPWLCPTFNYELELLGCTLANAYTIRTVIKNKKKGLIDVSPHAYPWSCLVCCEGYSARKRTPLARIFGFAKEGLGCELEGWYPGELPDHVRKVIDRDPSPPNPNDVSWLFVTTEEGYLINESIVNKTVEMEEETQTW